MLSLVGFYLTCRQEAPTQFREFIATYESKKKGNKLYSLVNPILGLNTNEMIQNMNASIQELERSSKEGSDKIKQTTYLSGLGYQFAHMMNITIFLADCKIKNINLVIIDDEGYNKLITVFSKAAPILSGYSKAVKVKEGTPDWFLINSLNKGTDKQFSNILKENRIGRHSLNDIAKLIHANIPFYIFRPPLKIMKITLAKIQKSGEVDYFNLYEKSCNILGIKDVLLPLYRIKELMEYFQKAHEHLMQEENHRKLNLSKV